MGLDMHLSARKYMSEFFEPKLRARVSAALGDMSLAERVNGVTLEAAYWRKANAINKWFVDNVQGGDDDCKEYYVRPEKLSDLVEVCQRVLKYPSMAPDVLPPQGGFFFGSTAIDEWYRKDLQNTIDMLTPLLPLAETGEFSFYYHSSW